MNSKITFRAVIEVLGKPKEHVEQSIKSYVDKLKADENFKVLNDEFTELKKQDEQELWATFSEVEVETEKLSNLASFCFQYMPSLIEIIGPKELKYSETELSLFLNDLQTKLHQVDMVAKQVKLENDHLKKNMSGLMKNYLQVLLTGRSFSSQQLSNLTGVNKEKLEDYLDVLIDEKKIDLKDGVYFLNKKEENKDGRKSEES
jgi:hypothetical protein